jgi:hypothetical protein
MDRENNIQKNSIRGDGNTPILRQDLLYQVSQAQIGFSEHFPFEIVFKPLGSALAELNIDNHAQDSLAIPHLYQMYLRGQNKHLKEILESNSKDLANDQLTKWFIVLIRALNETHLNGNSTKIDENEIPSFKFFKSLDSLRVEFLMSLQNARHYLLIKRDSLQFRVWFEKVKQEETKKSQEAAKTTAKKEEKPAEVIPQVIKKVPPITGTEIF